MQLKMPNTINVKLLKEILIQEEKFISNVFAKMPVSIKDRVAQKDQDEEEEEEEDSEMKSAKKRKIFPLAGEKTNRAKSFEELHMKLDELKSKGKLDHRQRCLKKNLKNRLKKKSKREERLIHKKLARTEQMAAGVSKNKEENGEVPKVPKQKPIFNSEGHMVFSKFDFSQIGTKRKSKTEKNPKKILQQIEEKKQKVKELVESGEHEKANEIKEKEAWKSVLAKASGEKIKDDPELLKKSIKREEQKKQKSSKKWEARNESVQKSIQERQRERQENILKRKKDKKTNKLKKASKKGRIIPGF